MSVHNVLSKCITRVGQIAYNVGLCGALYHFILADECNTIDVDIDISSHVLMISRIYDEN
jgi:hypothetical protein